MNIIYLRVSKEDETLQDLDIQAEEIKKKFPIFKDAIIYKERGSAYDLDKFDRRKEFIDILKLTCQADKTTLLDCYLRKYNKTNINIGVWDWSRNMRNLELGLFTSLIFKFFNITVYSHKQGILKVEDDAIPVERFVKYVLASANSFEAESYSWNISENVKKQIVETKDSTYSTKGKKWGGQFKDKLGVIVQVTPEEIVSIKRRILFLIAKFEKEGKTRYYPELIEIIYKERGIELSASYISRCKNDKS